MLSKLLYYLEVHHGDPPRLQILAIPPPPCLKSLLLLLSCKQNPNLETQSKNPIENPLLQPLEASTLRNPRLVVTASSVHDPDTPGGNQGSKVTNRRQSGILSYVFWNRVPYPNRVQGWVCERSELGICLTSWTTTKTALRSFFSARVKLQEFVAAACAVENVQKTMQTPRGTKLEQLVWSPADSQMYRYGIIVPKVHFITYFKQYPRPPPLATLEVAG